MKKIQFRKVLKYDPTIEGTYTLYQGYSKSVKHETDPEIISIQHTKLKYKPDCILSSPLLRARKTAEVFATEYGISEIILHNDLIEIPFNLNKLVSETEFIQKGSTWVRKRFIESFISNSLEEKHASINKRIDNVLTMLYHSSESRFLLISHSFYMKIFEAYLEYPELFKNPELIRNKFDFKRKTYSFGEGFIFQLA